MTNDFFSNIGIESQGIIHLSPKETYALCSRNKALLLDVRENYTNNFRMFNILNILYLPLSELKNKINLIPKDIAVVCADSIGLRSKDAVFFLVSNGFTNVANMAGGIVEWEKDNLPVLVDENERISGGCMCVMKKKDT